MFLLGIEVSSIILRVFVVVSINGLKVFIPPKALERPLHKVSIKVYALVWFLGSPLLSIILNI